MLHTIRVRLHLYLLINPDVTIQLTMYVGNV